MGKGRTDGVFCQTRKKNVVTWRKTELGNQRNSKYVRRTVRHAYELKIPSQTAVTNEQKLENEFLKVKAD